MPTKEEAEAGAAAVNQKLQDIKDALADYFGDVAAAFKALQDAIAAGTTGPDLGPLVASLAGAIGTGDDILASIKGKDTDAETVSGQPTPPPVVPAA